MGKVCRHEFDTINRHNPQYSQLEYDLYARLDMTLVKNHESGQFEIIGRKTREVVYKGTLEEMVTKANELEGAENTTIECHRAFCRD